MIVDKVWKLTNTVRVGLDPRSSHTERQTTFPDNVCSYSPPNVSHYENLTTFLFFWNFFQSPRKCSRANGQVWSGLPTTSDDVGGKSVSEKTKSVGGQCVGENSTCGNSDAIRISSKSDGQVKYGSDLDELLGISTTSMDFDVSSVEGGAHLQAYLEVQQVPNGTDPLMWWKKHQQEFPELTQMTRQYLTVPVTSVSPERFFRRVGLVQTPVLPVPISRLSRTYCDL
jgi:hypothetical protein